MEDSPRSGRSTPSATGAIQPAERQAWAERYVAVVRDGNRDEAERLIDGEAILARALAKIDLTNDSKALVGKRFRERRPVAKMVDFVHRHTSKGGSIAFLRASQRDDLPTAIVRVVFDDGNFDYQEFALARRADGTVFAEDSRSAVIGEFMSESTCAKCGPLAQFEKRPAFERLMTGLALQSSEKEKERFEAAAEAEKAEATLAAWEKLDAPFQATKAVRLARMTALDKLGRTEESDAILAQWRAESPDDLGAAIVAVVKRRQRGDPAGALSALAIVEQAMGEDPFLVELREKLTVEAATKHEQDTKPRAGGSR